jgi:uncharacterized protein DUF4177
VARYQYLAVHMDVQEGKGFIRYEKGAPESSLHDTLAELAAKGWRYVGYVPTSFLQSYPAGQLVFEREVPG